MKVRQILEVYTWLYLPRKSISHALRVAGNQPAGHYSRSRCGTAPDTELWRGAATAEQRAAVAAMARCKRCVRLLADQLAPTVQWR